jgi:hypothetical protein
MYQTFYSIVFKKLIPEDFEFSVASSEVKVEGVSIRENVLMIEANCTPREMIKFLADNFGDAVEEIGLIVRNESFEPDWSVIRGN